MIWLWAYMMKVILEGRRVHQHVLVWLLFVELVELEFIRRQCTYMYYYILCNLHGNAACSLVYKKVLFWYVILWSGWQFVCLSLSRESQLVPSVIDGTRYEIICAYNNVWKHVVILSLSWNTLLLKTYLTTSVVNDFSVLQYTLSPVPDLLLCLGMLKHVQGHVGVWVIYNSFEFVADVVYMSNLI